MQSLKDICSMAADLGWPVASMFVCHRLLESISGSRARLLPYVYVVQPFGGVAPPLRPDPSVTVGRVRPGDTLVAQIPRDTRELAARWARGSECFGASVGGVFAGQIWCDRGPVVDDEVRCSYALPSVTAVWDFDVWVAPRFRIGRTMARLWRHVDEQLAAEGVRWTFSRISMYNAGSIRSHARLGATTVRRAVFLLLGPMQVMWSNAAPKLQFSWCDRGRPVITLTPPDAGASAPSAQAGRPT